MAKKIWEQLQEQEQQYLEQAKQTKQETQEKFEKIASKNDETETFAINRNNSNNVSIWDRVKYVAKRFGNETLGGVTSIGEAETQTIANNLQRGRNKKISKNITNNVENLFNIANPLGNMNRLFKNNLKDSIENITDKNKTFKEKVVAQGLNSVSNAQSVLPVKNALDDSTQLLGKILPEQASEKVLKAGDKISEPYYKNNEKLNEEAQKYGTGTNLAGEVLGSVGRMVPSIAGTAITKNPNVGLALMGTGAKGNATKEALDKGASLDEAVKIGDTQRAIEIGTEMISGGVNIFGKGALDDIVEKGISSKVKSNVGKFLAKQGYNLGGEVLEETISDVLDTFIKQGTTDKNASYSLKDFGDTAVTTMLSTLVLNTLTGGLAGDVKTIKNENKSNQNAQEWINKAQDIVNNTNNKKIQQNTPQTQTNLAQEQNNINQEKNNIAQNENMNNEQIAKNIINSSYLSNNIKQNLLNEINGLDINNEGLEQIKQIVKDNSNLKSDSSYKTDNDRKKTYMKYKNDTSKYDTKALDLALDAVEENRNGKRTVKQWLEVADKLGSQLAEKNNDEIERIAFRSWNDLKPNTKDSITRYDNRTKTNETFKKFTSDDWVNKIYESVNKTRENIWQTLDGKDEAINEINAKQQNSILNNKELPMQSYQYEKSDNVKINNLRQDANKYFNNSEKSRNYVNMLEKIITDKDVEIRLDADLKTADGRIANGSYSNGVITINPNSDRTGEFIAVHELTHAIGTDSMRNIIENYRKSNAEFDNAVKSLLKNYNTTELTDEAMADVSAQLLGNQEYINNLAQTNPNLFQKIYSEIKYLWHQFRGYKNQDQFIEDLQYKWEQAYRNNNKLNNSENYLKAKLTNGEDTVISDDVNGTNPTEAKARKTLENMLGIKYINEGNQKQISIENRDIGKFLHDGYNNHKNARLKKRIAGNYGEVIEIAKEDTKASKPNYKGTNRGRQGYDYYNVNLTYPIRDAQGNIVDYNNYEARLVVRKDNNNNFAYDLDNFDKKNGATLDKTSLSIASDKSDSGSFINNSILPTKENVNRNTTNYNMQENENNSSVDNKGRKLSKEQQDRYKYMSNELRDENGNIKNYYHGTKRADRVGNIFDPNKATSGPMAFFTDNEDIAKSYSENKQDTSLSREYDTEYDLFKINNKSLDEYWNSLSKEQQSKINQEGYNIGLDEDFENIVHEKDASKNSFSSQYEYYLKNEENNNGIKALYDVFIQDGNLMFEDIKKFEDVLKYAGIDNIQYLDPYKVDSKVYNVYLNIKNPFNTSNITSDMIDKFKEASKNAKKGESYSADQWDKTNISPEQWISRLDDDIKNGTSHAWTSIPDWVTEVLKKNGYDGIVDKGGKNGGEEHQVVIPFYSEQIKNVDNTNPTDNPDIRYSKNNQEWQEYLDNNIEPKGTRTKLQDIKLPTKETSNEGSINFPTKQKANLPLSEKKIETQQNTSEILIPMSDTLKQRKHYKTIMNSSNVTPEARKIAKELIGNDTYVPQNNVNQLENADKRIIKNGADNEAIALRTKVSNGDKITPDDIATGERLIQYYSKTGNKEMLQDTIQNVALAGTQAGQTVQAMSLIHRQTPEGQAMYIQKIVDNMNKEIENRTKGKGKQFDLTPDMIEKIVNSKGKEQLHDNIEAVAKELGQQVPKTTIEKIDSWRYFSMLGNPRTHIRNIIGNLSMGKVQGISNKVAGTIEAVAQKTGIIEERTKTIVPASLETRKFAKEDVKNVMDRLDNGGKFDAKNLIQQYQRTFKSNILENTLGKLYNLNSKALELEDVFGLKSAYKKHLADYMTANKLTSEYFKTGSKESNIKLEKARQYAIQKAQEATFHQVSSLSSLLSQFENKNKFTKLAIGAVIPFKKTPINVAKTGIEYSPVGLVKAFTLDIANLNKGKINANQYIDNLAKGLTGTGITMVGYALAQAGILKASGGSDDEKKTKYDEDRGKQAFSLKIGDKTYTLDWLSPTAIPLFIGAELNNNIKSSEEEQTKEDVLDKISNSIDAFSSAMNPMIEMSMLSGLASTIKSFSQGDTQVFQNLAINAGKSYVNQFVPTISGQIARTIDDTERSTTSTKKNAFSKAVDSTGKQILSKIPVASKLLPAKTDVWGNEQKRDENVLMRGLQQMAFPWYDKTVKSTKVDNAISDLYEATGEKSVLPNVTLSSKDFTINKQKYRMTSEEFAQYKKSYGKVSYELLNSLVNSNNYKKMTNEQKKKAIKEIYSYANENNKINYAKSNDLKVDESTIYKTVKAVKKSGGEIKDYFNYIGSTEGLNKDKEKLKVLSDANYSDNTKSAIYSNTIGEDDDNYNNILKKTNIDINEYLKYKQQKLESDKKDDGTLKGKPIANSKKDKTYNYINSMNINYDSKLLLLGMQYKLTTSEREKVVKIIDNLPDTSKNEKLEIYDKMQGFTVYKNGTIKF